MADEIITRQQLIEASADAESLQKFISGTDVEDVLTRLGQKYPTLAKLVRILMETGGFEPFATEAQLLASTPLLPKKASYALDTHNIFLWQNGVWSNTGVGLKAYIDNKWRGVTFGSDLNTYVEAGNYAIPSAVLAEGVAKGNLNYPQGLKATYGATLSVYRSGTGVHAYQVFTTTGQKGIWSRQFIDNANFGAWINHLEKEPESPLMVAGNTLLSSYTESGVYSITSAVLNSGISDAELDYPRFVQQITPNGAMLIVGHNSTNYTYQMLVCTNQSVIATRQSIDAHGNFGDWRNILAQQEKSKKVITFASSTFYFMSNAMSSMISSLGGVYTSDAIAGQAISTMMAHQESNKISISFSNGNTNLNGVASPITLTQTDLGLGEAYGAFNVTLSNGLKGLLNIGNRTFTASNAIEEYETGTLSFDVSFGYGGYRRDAVHIFNIGKNNITAGSSAETVIAATVSMVDYIKDVGNDEFIVVGHFIDRGYPADKKEVVRLINAELKSKYGLKYFDLQDYLMSSQIWIDIGITPTDDDLAKQQAGELAVSLSKDSGHVSKAVNNLFVNKIKERLVLLNYL
ncbi:pyocin knob domain-containing protein [Acinetobacter baumannii]|uniref:pyocin knob domain-containing protein n=1 Tax=Acinetobacter baumannii TaxID=470 RepID=UPI0038924280